MRKKRMEERIQSSRDVSLDVAMSHRSIYTIPVYVQGLFVSSHVVYFFSILLFLSLYIYIYIYV
jgi:hypothetical protein